MVRLRQARIYKENLHEGNERMTTIYFVRHAQPEHTWDEDRTRPLSVAGLEDIKKVTEIFKNFKIDYYLSSPYKRSFDTIKESAEALSMDILTDERFREREKGLKGNDFGMFQKRWNDFDFHEEGGESLNMVQKRNIEALLEVLNNYRDKNIIIGTHGTALSTILNYFEPSYCCDDFLRIIDYMPYIIRLEFDGINCIG
ncbi:MAG: 2,3-bisphosphoglycerate-dependent phosphoglycerate mutase, partial [Clostridium sp.]